jgi:PAS domain S-box-containing protein
MIFCSEGCRALTGYDPADFIENRKIAYARIIHPEDQDRVWREVQSAVAESRPFQLSYRIHTATGEEKWVWEQGCCVATDSGTYLEGFISDITERKLVEDQLRQAQKMEVVGQLTGGVAHDFNNLLAIMIGNLELAAETAEPGTEHHNHISRALSAAERGATLTRQLLAFSRKQVLQPQLVDLNKLVPRATELLHRALGEHVEVETVLAGGLWKTLVDPGQLEHALLNLAVNARDAMPTGGRLTIETANARLDEDYRQLNRYALPGPYVMLAVSDTGTGMPPEVAARAFEPFFTTKEVGKGSGLGLSMVYGFVKQSGGHVKIYSEVGRGTTVKLYFPRAREQATPILERPAAAAPPGGRTILVVEDDPDVRRLSTEALGDAGYRILEASDGQTALGILKDGHEVDLLFTDLVLPGGVDGIGVAEQARAMCPNIKVLFTTGYSYNAAKRTNGIEETADVLAKPFRKTELIRKIREVLGHERPETESDA